MTTDAPIPPAAAAGRRPVRHRLRLAPEGVPFVALPLVGATVLFGLAALFWLPLGWAGLPLLLAGLFSAYFFRDPDRAVPEDPSLLLAPADGRVVMVESDADGLSIGIFLNIFNVHVNRAPAAGRVVDVQYRPGRFMAAFRPEAEAENERNDLHLDCGGRPVLVRQVAGLIARRIVCRVGRGDAVAAGARFGMIRFGSSTVLRCPPGTEPLVRRGDRVRGGLTAVARWGARGPSP
jgi:phosphatidylserine decarboxylase